MQKTGSDRRAAAAGLGILLAVQLGLVWGFSKIPSNDGPAHQYSAWVYHELRSHAASPLGRWFVAHRSVFYPNAAYDLFLATAASVVRVGTAEKVGLTVYLVGLPLALFALARALGRDGWLPAFLALPIAFNYLFFMGFYNSPWGVPLVFALLALFVRTLDHPTAASVLACNALLALTYWAHLVAFAVALAAGGVIAVMRGRRLLVAFACLAPAAVLGVRQWPSSVDPHATWKSHGTVVDHARSLASLRIAIAFGTEPPAWRVGLVLLAGSAWGLVRCRRPGSGVARALCLAFLALAVTAPEQIGTGSYLGERLALFCVLFLAASASVPGRRAPALVATAAGGLVLAQAVFLYGVFADFREDMRAYLASVPYVPRGADFCPFTYIGRSRSSRVQPFATVHSYFAMASDSPNFFHYQALPEEAEYFLVRYTPAALARAPASLPGYQRTPVASVQAFADYLVTWRVGGRVLGQAYRAGYHRLFECGAMTLLGRSAPPMIAHHGAPAGSVTR